MRRTLAAIATLALLTAPALAQLSPPSGGGLTCTGCSANDLLTYLTSTTAGHITPATGVATALGNPAGGSGGFALQSSVYAAPTLGSTSIGSGATVTAITGMASFGITAPTANTTAFTVSGYSVTGSDSTHPMESHTGTLNTSGAEVVDNWAITCTSCGSAFAEERFGGAAGATLLRSLDMSGNEVLSGGITVLGTGGISFGVGGTQLIAVAPGVSLAFGSSSSTTFAMIAPGSTNDARNILQMAGAGGYCFVPAGSFGDGNGSLTDACLTRAGTGNLRLGKADAASPVAQTFSVQNVLAGNGNTAGANFTIQGSLSNGSGGGDLILKTTLASAASGAQNTAATALTLKGGTQAAIFAGQVTLASSTTGAGTETFTNSPCSGLTTEQWIPVGITGQTGTWYVPACQ